MARQGYSGVAARRPNGLPSAMTHGVRAHNWGRGQGSSLSSFCPLEPQPVCGVLEGAGLLTSAPRSLGVGGQHNSLCSLTLGPFREGLSLLPPAPAPCCPSSLTSLPPPSCSHSPMTGLPEPHWPAREYLPLFGQAAPGQASTPSPTPAGLSFSLRLFEVWLWGPGGRRFKRTFWLSHFLTAPVL